MIFVIFPSLSEVFSNEENKDLRRQINELILNRDKFAHGNIFIDAENDKVIIQYYSRGKRETEISPEVISEITKSADFIKDKLHVLNDYFRTNRLEIEKEEF
ncbi:hypothetical protein BMS3Bbin07_00355 [bacterium BMS3Bbin07]|nr:hypothetical protein BMS3Bbin07_00355 [bacterium BMS3Bbin07]